MLNIIQRGTYNHPENSSYVWNRDVTVYKYIIIQNFLWESLTESFKQAWALVLSFTPRFGEYTTTQSTWDVTTKPMANQPKYYTELRSSSSSCKTMSHIKAHVQTDAYLYNVWLCKSDLVHLVRGQEQAVRGPWFYHPTPSRQAPLPTTGMNTFHFVTCA